MSDAEAAIDLAQPSAVAPPRAVGWAIRKNPLALAALTVIIGMTACVFLAPVIAPYDPLQQDLDHLLEGPSALHWLGTDDLGRDTLTRLLHGGQPALLGVLVAVLVFLVLGLLFGLLAGYLGGKVDRFIGAGVDILMSLPGIVLVLAVLSIFSQNVFAAMFTFGVLVSGNLIRIVRASVLAIREELYVAAATVSGLSSWRIMTRHVIPGIVGPTVVQLSLFAGGALGLQTGLGFLGLATPPPAPSWGGMVGEAAAVMTLNPFLLFVSGGTIALMTLAFVLLGDAIRDLNADRKRPPSPRRRAVQRAQSPSGLPSGDPGVLLEVRDYSITFAGLNGNNKQVVDHVTFSVRKGEIVGLVGESGSGKTVTALSLLGLLPPNAFVSSGGAWLEGAPITGLDPRALRALRGKRIGLVSQEPMVALDPLFTVGSQLDEVLRHLTALDGAGRRARAIQLLKSVQLSDPDSVLRKYPHELSGGMIQRVVIAIALAGEPDLLIADEPTTALDVTVQAGILDLLRQLREERGLTVLIVTHDLGVVADVCDRAIVLASGQIVEQGTVDDIFYNSQHPYTRKLLSSTPSLVDLPHV